MVQNDAQRFQTLLEFDAEPKLMHSQQLQKLWLAACCDVRILKSPGMLIPREQGHAIIFQLLKILKTDKSLEKMRLVFIKGLKFCRYIRC